MSSSFIVFSDLERTIHDEQNQGLEAVNETIEKLKKRSIPLDMANSKALDEFEFQNKSMGIYGLFAGKNGGAVLIRKEDGSNRFTSSLRCSTGLDSFKKGNSGWSEAVEKIIFSGGENV